MSASVTCANSSTHAFVPYDIVYLSFAAGQSTPPSVTSGKLMYAYSGRMQPLRKLLTKDTLQSTIPIELIYFESPRRGQPPYK